MNFKTPFLLVLLVTGVIAFGAYALNGSKDKEKHPVQCGGGSETESTENAIQFKQDYWYHIKGINSNSCTRNDLIGVSDLADLIEFYPINWIENYVSVTVTASRGEDKTVIKTSDSRITQGIKELFAEVTPNTDIEIEVDYTSTNPISKEVESNVFRYWTTVVPQKQAQFAYGNDSLINYLRATTESTVKEKYDAYLGEVRISFFISDKGVLNQVRTTKSSGNQEFDNYLMEALQTMPEWTPATSENGKSVEQEFEFVLTLNNC
ncbi:MAG: energy transducer TonB [Bacteroidia bacterium]|nr:energy transducer TonB [Bacteroidia bacterium]